MVGFEDYQTQASLICKEVEWRLTLLGVDWHDDAQLRSIAREALAFKGESNFSQFDSRDANQRVRAEVFGFIGLMWVALEEAATLGRSIDAGELWTKLSEALWAEKGEAGE